MRRNEQKITVLKEKFEVLKDQPLDPNEGSGMFHTIAEHILAPMLSLDFEEGCRMWEYMLDSRYRHCNPFEFSALTDALIDELAPDVLMRVLREQERIKNYLLLLDPCNEHLYLSWFFRDLIDRSEYDLAEEWLALFFRNGNGENDRQQNLYEVLHAIVRENRRPLREEGVAFVSRWSAKLTSEARRAKIEVALLAAVEPEEEEEEEESDDAPFTFKITFEADDDSGDGEDVEEDERPQAVFDGDALEQALAELDGLTGLAEVKDEITTLTNLVRIRLVRAERGMKVPETSQHLVFSGNPGTGKTTVARLLGKVYHALGYLSKGHLIEVDRSGLVAGYVGQTALKTQQVITRALGGILFIDEAYALATPGNDNDYGQEAIDTILKAMEDHREDFVVIAAGYDELMPQFIDANPGLKSRFNKYILFPDYNGAELFSIFQSFLARNDYVIDEEAAALVAAHLEHLYQTRDENFGNARTVRNLFERMISNQANRLMHADLTSDDVIARLTAEDVSKAL